jgi:zinc protease
MTPMATKLVFMLSVVAASCLVVGAERDSVVLNSPGNPLAAFRLVFHVGSSQDPPGKEGLAALTALMLSQGGTEEMSLTEVIKALYPMASRVRAQADKEITTFIGRTHRDHLEDFYKVLRDRIQRPRFDAADFQRNKKELLDFVETSLRSANDENLAKHSLEWLLYDAHPYRHPVQGTVEGLQAITLDDVKAFYKESYTSENLQIGLAGDFPDGFAEGVREDFEKSLPQGEGQVKPLPEAPAREKMDVLIVEKPTADSTAISLGFPLSITRADEDFYPLLLANIYLGDHRSFHGVLMNELRAKRGLNYGNYSYIENFIQDGGSTFPVPNVPRRQQYFSIWIRPVATENAHFALRGAVFYLRRLVEHGMTDEEFEAMKAYVLSYSKLWVQSLDRRLGYQLDSSYYQTPFYIDEIEQRLRTMSFEDVNRAVKKYLDRWDFRVAMVTADASSLAEAVKSNTKSPVTYQTEGTSEHVLAEDAKIEVLALPIGSVRIVAVGEIFQK